MVDIAQVAFTKGEISPIKAARTDQQMYASALQTCINFLVHAEGGASNRPGLQFIAPCITNTPNGSYLLPFVYNNSQTYVTEFSAGSVRLYSNGAFVQNTSTPATITNVVLTSVSPGLWRLTYTAVNTFLGTQVVTVSGVVYTGQTNPNGTFVIETASGSQFTVLIGGPSPSVTYISGGTATVALSLSNPYVLADLPNLRWAQSADTLNVVVSSQPMYQLKRLTATSFTFAAPQLLFGPFQDLNTDGSTYVYTSGTQGTVTITASRGIFTPQHVGALFTIEEQFLNSITEWTAQSDLAGQNKSAVGTLMRSDSKIYTCVAPGANASFSVFTGTFQPVHDQGTQQDGNGTVVSTLGACGVSWQYLSTNAGVALITQYISATQVKAVVQNYKGIYRNFPPTVVGGPVTSVGPFSFTGNGSQVTFSPLTAISTGDPNQFFVTVAGVFQDPSTYTINQGGASITFYTPPANSAAISVAQVVGTLTNNYNQSGTLTPLTGLCLSTYWAFGSLSQVQGYASDVAYYNDRLVLASSTLQPQSFWMSQVSDYLNMGVSDPQVDSDAITETLNARQQNPINNLLALNNLLLGTASASWRVTGSSGIGAVTPSDIDVVPQEYFGMQPVPALQTGTTAVYVQWGGRKIRDVIYQFYNDKFMGQELTVDSRQMFPYGTTATRIGYAPEPYGLIFVVRSDGVMCVCTYLPEQQVVAWSRWITAGLFEDVCVVPENGAFSVYVIVGRTILGGYQRSIERFAVREFVTTDDAFFVDSGLTYDGRNTTGTTMTLTGGSTWLALDTGTLTASTGQFTGNDPTLSNEIWLFQKLTFTTSVDGGTGGTLTSAVTPGTYVFTFSDGSWRSVTVAADGLTCSWLPALESNQDVQILSATVRARLLITGLTSGTQVSVSFLDPVPVGLQGVATTSWTFARTTFSGLTNLIGQTVSVFADSSVLPQQVVSIGGTITLPIAGGVVHAGLPYTCRMRSLNFNQQGQDTIRNKQKTVSRVSMVVDDSYPFLAGPDFGTLSPVPQRQYEPYTAPVQTYTGVIVVRLTTELDDDATLCVQVSDPVPVRILSWIPDVDIGEPQ